MLNMYVQRLLGEWNEYGKIIIALDFDDTIYPFRTYHLGRIREVIRLVKEAQRIGAYVVINTASIQSRYEKIRLECKSLGLKIEPEFNENPTALPFGDNGKMYANIYLDDRSGLESAMEILTETIKLKRKL